MDVAVFVLLPGPPSVEKAVLGILPDAAVFVPGMIQRLVKKTPLPKFRTREEMMEWYSRKENRWSKNLYRWTHSLIVIADMVPRLLHSLIVWIVVLAPILFFYYRYTGQFLWFLLAAPLHILMDIPTHTKDSFPVQFLTPFSRLQVNGIHWSNRWVLISNYCLIMVTGALRILKYRGVIFI